VSILHEFGGRLAETFHKAYPQHFKVPDFFDFVESVDSHIHVEVMKLYPDAELPSFVTRWEGDAFILEYRSARPFAALAEGLLLGAIAHWGGRYALTRRSMGVPGAHEAIFELRRT
jgi:hypothetical protein